MICFKLKCIIFWQFYIFITIHGKITHKLDYDSIYIEHTPLSVDNIKIRSREGNTNGGLIAKATLKSSVSQTGWDVLEVWTNGSFPDEKQAFWGGYSEGCITTTIISQHADNIKLPDKIVKDAHRFVEENHNWIKLNIKKLKFKNGIWWQISLFYTQLSGLFRGYRDCKRKSDKDISFSQFFLMNADGDMHDLLQKFNIAGSDYQGTAIVKLLPNNKDLFVGHTTWNRYNYMLRVLKNYIFHYRLSSKSKIFVPGVQITFSGYPGVIYSTDDFYTISSGLTVTQTWISSNKKKLWNRVKPERMVLAGPRIMAANRLANDNMKWFKTLAFKNSGTFNNQWLVINYKLFRPKKPLRKGLFSLIEQLPRHVFHTDMTKLLEKERFFASHNLPKLNKTLKQVDKPTNDKYRSYFLYEQNPVIKLVEKKQAEVVDLPSMISLMRYNNYKRDYLSMCEECHPPYSASIAIAGRCDLNPRNGTYPLDLLGFHPSGAIDGKVTSYDLSKSHNFGAVSGPPSVDVSVFNWDNNGTNMILLKHAGQPDEWNFEPLITKWEYVVYNEELEKLTKKVLNL